MLSVCVLIFGAAHVFGADEAAEPGLPKTIARLKAGEPDIKIVCLGDSVTGVYYHTGGRRAYPEMLGIALNRIYPKASPTMINAGISGTTTREAIARLEKDVLRHRPQLVTVMFTLNDMIRLSPEEFAANLTKIIEQCRGVGAEIMLCTPNGCFDTGPRPLTKMAEYMTILKRVGREQNTPVADCFSAYEEVLKQSPLEFSLLMSDEIHPNMLGHKLDAEVIAKTISGQKVSLADVGPLFPAVPKTVAALKSGKALTVLAMPPFDELIGPALKELNPQLEVKVESWPTADRTLVQIEEFSKKVREKKPDFVIVAVPASAKAESREQFQRSYTWILNWSLSFGYQDWDCIAVPATVIQTDLSTAEREQDQLTEKLILAQDLGTLARKSDDKASLKDLLAQWLREQTR